MGAISLRLEPELFELLKAIAKAEDRPLASLVRLLIIQELHRRKKLKHAFYIKDSDLRNVETLTLSEIKNA